MFPNDFSDIQEKRSRRRRKLPAIVAQFLQAYFGRVVAFVGEVVGAAREVVDDFDRLAQPGRQK